MKKISRREYKIWVLLFVLTVLSIFSLELKFQSKIFIPVIYIIVPSIAFLHFFKEKIASSKVKKLLRLGISINVILFLVYFAFQIINPYELPNNVLVNDFCSSNKNLCEIAANIFIKFKLFRIVTLSSHLFSTLFILHLLSYLVIKINKDSISIKRSILKIAFFCSIILFALPNFEASSAMILDKMVLLARVAHTPFNQRWTEIKGGNRAEGWIYTYADFIVRNTPENAKIFIPPQAKSWQSEGNVGYMRWFLFPRKLLSSADIHSTIPEEAEYVFIAHGNWVWGSDDYGWPKNSIDKSSIETIRLIDRKTLDETELSETAYELDNTKEVWGLIKLKK